MTLTVGQRDDGIRLPPNHVPAPSPFRENFLSLFKKVGREDLLGGYLRLAGSPRQVCTFEFDVWFLFVCKLCFCHSHFNSKAFPERSYQPADTVDERQ